MAWKVAVGAVAFAQRPVKAVAAGYLAVEAGDSLRVLHVGAEGEERGWVYGRLTVGGGHGWLPEGALGEAKPRAKSPGGYAVVAVDAPAAGVGYLPLTVGDKVVVQYVGSDQSKDAGWLFGYHLEGKERGWFAAQALAQPAAAPPPAPPAVPPEPPAPLAPAPPQSPGAAAPSSSAPAAAAAPPPPAGAAGGAVRPHCAPPARACPVELGEGGRGPATPLRQQSSLGRAAAASPPGARAVAGSAVPAQPSSGSAVAAPPPAARTAAGSASGAQPSPGRSLAASRAGAQAAACPPGARTIAGGAFPAQSSLGRAAAAAEGLGLLLLGVAAPPGTPWQYPLCDPEKRCFAGLLQGQIGEDRAKSFFRMVMDSMDGPRQGWDRPSSNLGRISRGTKWMVAAGCNCAYRYGGMYVSPVPFPPWMEEVLEVCMPLCGLTERSSWPNSCNINCYADGSDGIDWHADDEPLFQGNERDCRIISLSLGEERSFELRLAEAEGPPRPGPRLRLRKGDLCTMEGLTQRHYQHRVPKGGGQNVKMRLNLTWRWIVAHDPRRCGL